MNSQPIVIVIFFFFSNDAASSAISHLIGSMDGVGRIVSAVLVGPLRMTLAGRGTKIAAYHLSLMHIEGWHQEIIRVRFFYTVELLDLCSALRGTLSGILQSCGARLQIYSILAALLNHGLLNVLPSTMQHHQNAHILLRRLFTSFLAPRMQGCPFAPARSAPGRRHFLLLLCLSCRGI